MGKCLSKICWQFSVSQSCFNERKAAVESPVKGVVNDDHESPAFLKNHAFSMTNAAYADFEKTARAPPPATEADDGHPSGCQHLIRSPSTNRSSEDRISDNPVQIFEKSASRKEGPAESALTKCSSRKQSLDGSISSSPSLALSHADFVLTKSPSRSTCNCATHSPESECTACIFPSRSSITTELSENESKPCDDAMNMVQPLSTFGQEKESQTVSNADLLLEPCSICKKLNCNCCQLVTTLSSLIHESSELEVSDVSQLSDNPENAIDTPQVHQCSLKQSAIHEDYTDVKAKENGSAIRQSGPLATNHEVNPPEKLPAEMDLPAT